MLLSASSVKVLAALLRRPSQSINEVINVCGKTLMFYKCDSLQSSSWPIICIDEANVLTKWQYGSPEKPQALSTLLTFSVQVVQIQKCILHAAVAAFHEEACMCLSARLGMFCRGQGTTTWLMSSWPLLTMPFRYGSQKVSPSVLIKPSIH